ncbi:MAG: WD40 repeat domain-containing protein, partial [Deltaproteobacteria bacterium]|nr:WD40 repeat domain-containing protein [Deltaproteobacteria bacterium]
MAARKKKKQTAKAKAGSRTAKPAAKKAKPAAKKAKPTAKKAKPTAKKAKPTAKKAKPTAKKAKPAAKKAKPAAKKAKPAAGKLSLVASSFSRDGRWLATASEGKVHVWDLAPVRLGGHAALVLRVTESIFPDRIALSPDGTRLAVASHGHSEVRVYDATHGALAWTAALHAVTAIAFAPDGGRIVVGDVLVEEKARRGFAAVLDAATGVPVWRSPAVDRPLRDVAFHSD